MISQMTMITNESQARTLDSGCLPVGNVSLHTRISDSCSRSVIWIREHLSVWKNLGKACRMMQTRGAKPRLEVVRDARLNVRVR
jgi:hypothetical protein